MTPLFSKLNLGETKTIHILNAPQSFEQELELLEEIRILRKVTGEVTFAMAFVTTLADVERTTRLLVEKAGADASIWMVYPKRSSKNYQCEFNRDTGWEKLGAAGYEPVRQVAIDADWSALRFRKAEFIKTMERNPRRAISEQGKRKARKSRASD